MERYDRALEVRRANNDKVGEALTTCNIGNVYRRKGYFEQALNYQAQGLKLAEDIDYTRGKAICTEGLAYTYFDWEKYSETIEYAKLGLALSERTNLLENQVDFKHLLAESYAKLGDYATAYEYQADYILLEDSLSSIQSVAQINELEAKYQLRQKETDNQLLIEKQIRQEEALQKRSVLVIATLFTLIMMSLLAIVYYRSSKQKQAYNEQLQQAVEERTVELNHSVQVLKETNQELEDFAFIASHDLKEPLRSIISFNDLIQKKLKGQLSTEIKDYFAFVNTSGQQMYHLIESTLEFSRVGKIETPNEPTDLNDIIRQTKENLQGLIQRRKAIIEFESLPTIQSNPDQLYLIFKNLIENGIKYNDSAASTVSITYQNETDHQFTIKDNGIGISGEFHDKIFQMFKRLHDRGEYSGSGLGLSIVHKIVQRLGGHISLISEKGKGSTFIINIPDANNS